AVKPIVGCEFYVAPRSRFEKKSKLGEKPYYHFTMLARNEEGYRNLMRLSSYGYLEGYYYRPRIDMELLEKYHEGLIALSGCLRGNVPSLVINDELREAEELSKKFAMLYGDGNFYLELHDHSISLQKKVNEGLREIAKKTGLPMVAANDVHYTNREDHMAHDILLCIQTGNMVSDEKRLKFQTQEFYFKSPDEMKTMFSSFKGATANTIKIAERCNLELDMKTYHLPKYPMEGKQKPEEFLYELCLEGIKKKYGSDYTQNPAILERLEREFQVIKKMGFVDYFLITWDLIYYAKSQGVPVGPGRGSAAGSIVAYTLDITDIDPLKYDLLFERFLNDNRISMPDIDIDFCYERRGEIIKYVTEKYGADRVAQIITFGTMAAKASVRDVGRVLGIPLSDVDRIAKMIPTELNITIKEAIEKVPELKELYITNETYRNHLDYAINLEGLTRHASTHAAGIVISETPLTENTPLFRGKDNVVTTQYDMSSIEKIGLLKMDFLGLKTLTVIEDTTVIVKRTRGIDIDIRKIPLDDPLAFTLLNEGKTLGVFQLESSGMRSLMKRMGIDDFEEIIALIALYRPGPMNMLSDFINRKHKKIPIKYKTPLEEPILKNTYGIMLYQEQVMQIVNHIGNFSLAEADIFRRAISKKIPEVMDQSRMKFIDGAVENGVKKETAEKIFEDILQFAGYGFNKSHSAAYALISYQTAYLKANYPVEFMAALLDSELGNTDKIVEYIDECRENGIEVLPP
ncbi:DNA polymerase III subunit alpha, partial [PVC group bacterium]|nr:DNA polymerase III subunit alpha [PVC group bacterium]